MRWEVSNLILRSWLNHSYRGSHHSKRMIMRKRRQRFLWVDDRSEAATHTYSIDSQSNVLPKPRRYPTLRGYNRQHQNVVTLHLSHGHSTSILKDEILIQRSMLTLDKRTPLAIYGADVHLSQGFNPKVLELHKLTEVLHVYSRLIPLNIYLTLTVPDSRETR